MQRLDVGGSAKPRNAIFLRQCREVVCYEVKLSMNLANQIFCHLRYTPLRLVDGLKREKLLNNQLQPLTSKTDKKLLEIFFMQGLD